LLNQGKILEELYSKQTLRKLSDYEWKIFSQWGEDGIIQFLINHLKISHKTFIEFGVEDFFESNCRYLMQSSGWRGLVIDGSVKNIDRLRNSHFYWKHDLQSVAAFVTEENINRLIGGAGFENELGILSVDIDGNDYHILKALSTLKPSIIISEFNPCFGTERAITVPYDEDFIRSKKHYSNLYYGASIKALEYLLSSRGYVLVGTGMAGANAYFVDKNLLTEQLRSFAEQPYNFNAHYRESRDMKGKLNFYRDQDRIKQIKGMPVMNVLNEKMEEL